jgi:hypothetical protein
MAELLKNKYQIDVAEKISKMICEVHPTFDSEGFVEHVQQGGCNEFCVTAYHKLLY